MRRASLFRWIALLVLICPVWSDASAYAQARRDSGDARTDRNKALVRRWIEEGFNQRSVMVVDELFGERFAVNGHVIGRDGLKQSMSRHLAGFPDLHVTIDEILAEGHQVGIWYTVEGTHRGEFEGIPPTHKPVKWFGFDLLSLEGDRISEGRFVSDSLGLLRQLGATVSSPPAPAISESATAPNDEAALEREKAAIVEVIERQAAAFWAKDFQRWADTWVHAPYIRRLGWSDSGGVVSVEGWDTIGARMKKNMADNPTPNATPAKLVRERLNFRIYGDVAWVTFEQHGVSTGEPRFDMPGLSHETRILEKHDGRWRVAYLGYLLAGSPDTGQKR